MEVNLFIQDSKMKKFLIKIILFVILFIFFDLGYGKLCMYLRTNTHGGQTYSDNYIVDSLNADILLFGSSRVHQQYDPQIIMDSLKMSCYNCGRSGMGIIYHYGRWRLITRRYYPKYIIYDVFPVLDMMMRDDNIIFVNPLRNWYGSVSAIDSIFYMVDETERFKMLFNTYRNHSEFMDLISDYRDKYYNQYGFEVVNAQMTTNIRKVSEKLEYKIDPLKLFYFEKFMQETSGKTIVICVASPRYKYNQYGDASLTIINSKSSIV